MSLTKLSNNYIPFSDDSFADDSIIYYVFFSQLFSSYLNLFHVFWKSFRLFDFSKIHASWKESTLFWLALLFSVWHFFQQKIKMSRETPLQNKNKKRILFPYFNLSSLVVFSMICRKYNTILKTDDLSCTLLHNSLSQRPMDTRWLNP